jgi:hypothetical protein
MSPLRIVAEFFVDVVVALILIALGIAIGELAHDFLTPNLPFFHLLWFGAGMLPVAYYARWRKVLDFDDWDVLVFGPIFLSLIHLVEFLPLLAPTILAVVVGWGEFRKKRFPRPSALRSNGQNPG